MITKELESKGMLRQDDNAIKRICNVEISGGGSMTAYCWYCESQKEFNGVVQSTLQLAFGTPFPILDISVRSLVLADGKVKYFVCEDCRQAILRAIGESKVASIENVMGKATA